MPRKILNHDDMPRRRASKRSAADDVERGFAVRILLHSPKDTVAGAIAAVAVIAIIVNAMFLQAGRHPAPMFGSVTTFPAIAASPANPMPKPRPVEADVAQPDPRSAAEARPVDSKPPDPLGNLVRTTSAVPAASIPRPPMTIPVSHVDGTAAQGAGSRRVAAVQRALTEYGYGQLKPTGVVGSDTQSAIQKFERARKLPVTGQISDRLVRELGVVIGHPIE